MSFGKPEYERRFVVLDGRPVLDGAAPPRNIAQGYLNSSPEASSRIRISSDHDGRVRAQLTNKSGSGEIRQEDEVDVADLSLADALMRAARHQLHKTRFVKADDQGRGWEIDIFKGPLDGLVLAELESSQPLGQVTPPVWLGQTVDVTDTINNGLLAQLATELRHGLVLHKPLPQLLTERIQRVVFTGGPCSGKSTLCALLRDRRPDLFVVPEVATVILGPTLGISFPGHELGRQRLNQEMVNVQLSFETLADIHCSNRGLATTVLDRACMDNAAYDPEGIEGFERRTGLSRSYLYRRYDRVICIGTPSERVYQAQRANNPARRETYPEAKILGERVRNVWSGHHNFHFIDNSSSWENTVAQVMTLL